MRNSCPRTILAQGNILFAKGINKVKAQRRADRQHKYDGKVLAVGVNEAGDS